MPLWTSRVQEVTTHAQSGVPVEANGVTMSELHEIWQIEGKRHFYLGL